MNKRTICKVLVVAMVLPLFSPGGAVAQMLPSCGAAAADSSNPHWRDPTYLNCSDTFWGCTESGLPGNQATEDDPYCEDCTHAWDVGDDWDDFVRGYNAGYAVGFEATASADADEEALRTHCFNLANDLIIGGGTVVVAGVLASATGFAAPVGGGLTLWGSLVAAQGGLTYFYCRFRYD